MNTKIEQECPLDAQRFRRFSIRVEDKSVDLASITAIQEMRGRGFRVGCKIVVTPHTTFEPKPDFRQN